MALPRVGTENDAAAELPLLPHGAMVFADLPARALVLEALAPAIGNGLMRVQSSFGAAVILIRDAQLHETHVFTGDGGHATGTDAVDAVRGWPEAEVSADRLDAGLVDLCAALVRGEAVYEDLRLEWTSWPGLLADLARRRLTYVVELSTPAGRAVTCIAGGRQLLSYSDIHPSVADPAVLESMAAGGDGEVRVRLVPAATFAEAVASGAGAEVPTTARRASTPSRAAQPAATPAPTPVATPPLPEAPRAVTAAPAPRWPRPTAAAPPVATQAPSLATFTQSVAAPTAATPEAAAEPASAAAGPAHDREAPALRPTIDVLLPDLSWVAPWQTPWRSDGGEQHEPAVEPATAAASVDQWEHEVVVESPLTDLTVADVHDELREIAQRRLKLSASRVEMALDSAAAQSLPLDRVLEDLRSLSIRGVMQPTIDAMVDEMTAVAGRRAV